MYQTEDIEKKVKDMSTYLTNEAIAQALHLTLDAVEAILDGKADITIENQRSSETENTPIIHVSSVITSYRQKIISVVRAKGGVGCTVIAIGLAYLLSKELKTLLIEITPGKPPGDLAYYLDLEKYVTSWPEASIFAQAVNACEINIDPNFDVLPLSNGCAKDAETINSAISLARQNYDAVVIDLPNRMEEVYVIEAVEQSNTIVGVCGGMDVEALRLLYFLNNYPQKDVVLVGNRCFVPVLEGMERYEIAQIGHDSSLEKTFRRSDLPSLKSSFMKDITQIKETIYGEKPKGFLKNLLKS